MNRLIVLNSIAPKLRPKREPIDAHVRKWYTAGYRTGAPGTNTCREDTDCNPGEICQSGYCAGLHRKHNIHGLFFGNEYADMLAEPTHSLRYLEHGDYHRPHDFFYDYAFGDHHGEFRVNQPRQDDDESRERTDYDHSYSR